MTVLVNKVKELSLIERSVLLSIDSTLISLEEVASLSKTNLDSVRRAAGWLNQKGFAVVSELVEEKFFLTPLGEKIIKSDVPENILLCTLKELGGEATFSKLEECSGLSKQEFVAGLGVNKRKAFIVISEGVVKETGVGDSTPSTLVDSLKKVLVDSKKISDSELVELQKRGFVEKKSFVSRKIKISSNGLEAKKILSSGSVKRVFDVVGEVPIIFGGKRVPYIQFLSQIRGKLVSLGFKEMDSTLLTTEFYNFDVLFQPQNHPARTWTDTYQLKNPKSASLPNKKIVNAIKAAHENGGVSESKGWGGEWSEEVASRVMPSAHGTAHSARQLVRGVNSPEKYFSIARCFRPDVLDSTHLIEFNQLEGFIVGDKLNFSHLLGLLKEFAISIAGAEEVKFFPDYYPFTEPSVQLSAKHPELGWVEFAGAGMFRPEMLQNLGIKQNVIAWGMGIDRLAMFKLGVKDIRFLFSDDLSYLRNAKGVLL